MCHHPKWGCRHVRDPYGLYAFVHHVPSRTSAHGYMALLAVHAPTTGVYSGAIISCTTLMKCIAGDIQQRVCLSNMKQVHLFL